MHDFPAWILGVLTSPAGVVVLAALDSTLFFFMPFGIDAAVIVLAARLGGMAWLVPLLATAGSIGGATVTFWMGTEIGDRGLERYIPPRRLKHIRKRARQSGAVALAVLDLIPPPFPFTPFMLAAGALEVNPARFFLTLTVCRIVRFGGEALLARIYGGQILAWLDSNLVREIVGGCIILAPILTAVSIIRVVRSSRSARHHRTAA